MSKKKIANSHAKAKNKNKQRQKPQHQKVKQDQLSSSTPQPTAPASIPSIFSGEGIIQCSELAGKPTPVDLLFAPIPDPKTGDYYGDGYDPETGTFDLFKGDPIEETVAHCKCLSQEYNWAKPHAGIRRVEHPGVDLEPECHGLTHVFPTGPYPGVRVILRDEYCPDTSTDAPLEVTHNGQVRTDHAPGCAPYQVRHLEADVPTENNSAYVPTLSVYFQDDDISAGGTSTFSIAPSIFPAMSPEPKPLAVLNGEHKPEQIICTHYPLEQRIEVLSNELSKAKLEVLNLKYDAGRKIDVEGFLWDSWDEAMEDMMIQRDDFFAECEKTKDGLSVAESRVRVLQSELLASKELAKKLEGKLKNAENHRAGQERKIQASKANAERWSGLGSEVETLKANLVTAESQKSNLEHKLKTCSSDLKASREQAKSTQQKLNGLNEELKEATETIAELQHEVRTLEAERLSLERQLVETTRQHGLELSFRSAQENTAIAKAAKDNQDLKKMLDKLERKFTNREKEIKLLESENQTTASQEQELRQTVEVQDKRIRSLEAQLLVLQDNSEVEEASKAHQEPDFNHSAVNLSSFKHAQESLHCSTAGHLKRHGGLVGQLGTIVKQHEPKITEVAEYLHEQESLNQKYVASCNEKQEQLWAKNSSLRRRLESQDEERERQSLELHYLRNEIRDTTHRCIELESYVSELRASNIMLRTNQAQSSQQTNGLRNEPYTDFQSYKEISKDVNHQTHKHTASCDGLFAQLQSNIKIIKQLQDELGAKSSDMTTKFSTSKQAQFKTAVHQTALIQSLQSKIASLENEKTLNIALAQCAVEVRLGFLEHARAIRFEGSYEQSSADLKISLNGTIASQYANGELDALILTSGLVAAEYLESATETFNYLYSITPDKYALWGMKSARLVDCQASLKVIPPGDSLGLSKEDAKEYYKIAQDLLMLRSELGNDGFEESEEVEELVDKMDYLTGMIVTMRG